MKVGSSQVPAHCGDNGRDSEGNHQLIIQTAVSTCFWKVCLIAVDHGACERACIGHIRQFKREIQ